MIYVDADACPVKAEVEKVATRHRMEVRMVCDGGLRPSQNPLVQMVYVTEGLDAADNWIAETAGAGDIVVTSDIPLADRAIATGAKVLTFDGEELNERSIVAKLARRNAADAMRSENPLEMQTRSSRAKPLDKGRFSNTLERLVRQVGRTP